MTPMTDGGNGNKNGNDSDENDDNEDGNGIVTILATRYNRDKARRCDR